MKKRLNKAKDEEREDINSFIDQLTYLNMDPNDLYHKAIDHKLWITVLDILKIFEVE